MKGTTKLAECGRIPMLYVTTNTPKLQVSVTKNSPPAKAYNEGREYKTTTSCFSSHTIALPIAMPSIKVSLLGHLIECRKMEYGSRETKKVWWMDSQIYPKYSYLLVLTPLHSLSFNVGRTITLHNIVKSVLLGDSLLYWFK